MKHNPTLNNEHLYGVCVIFNPHNYRSRIRLYHEFASYIAFSGVKLFTVEIAYGDRPFEVTTPYNKWNLQLRTNHILWHKERALNLGIEQIEKLVPDVKYIAVLDADIRFTDPYWPGSAVEALHHHKVIQLFSQCIYLDPKNEMMWSCKSRFYHWANRGYHQKPPKPLKYIANGHPGMAWAFRMETLKHLGGLLDFSITGSGDTHMANALMGDVIFNSRPGMSKGFHDRLKEWEVLAMKHVNLNIGYIDGACCHYWHGKSDKRGYDKRWDITCFHQFDPDTDIVIEENGLYAYAGNKSMLEYDINLSLGSRDEDSRDM